jgi:hypothetical protein
MRRKLGRWRMTPLYRRMPPRSTSSVRHSPAAQFPPETVSGVMALATAVHQAVLAFAPAVLGIPREVSGSYWILFLAAAGDSARWGPAWSSLVVEPRRPECRHGLNECT